MICAGLRQCFLGERGITRTFSLESFQRALEQSPIQGIVHYRTICAELDIARTSGRHPSTNSPGQHCFELRGVSRYGSIDVCSLNF